MKSVFEVISLRKPCELMPGRTPNQIATSHSLNLAINSDATTHYVTANWLNKELKDRGF